MARDRRERADLLVAALDAGGCGELLRRRHVCDRRGHPASILVSGPGGGRGSRILGGGEGSRSVWVAVVSTVLFFVVAGILIVRSPGWSAPGGVRQQFFDGAEFCVLVAEDPGQVLAEHLHLLRRGGVRARLRAAARGDAQPAGPVVRAAAGPCRRRTPILFRGLPDDPRDLDARLRDARPRAAGRAELPDLLGDRGARARLLGVRRGGLPRRDRVGPSRARPRPPGRSGSHDGRPMRHVVLPQAIRRVVPPLLNDFIGLQKDSALVAFLGVTEGLLHGADHQRERLQLHAVRGARARLRGDHGARRRGSWIG